MKFTFARKAIVGLATLGILAGALVAVSPVGVAAAGNNINVVAPAGITNGQTFNVDININTDQQIAGAQATITWDATKFTYNSATGNTVFHMLGTPFFGAGQFNSGITTTASSISLTSTTGGPSTVTGSGTWATLSFTATAAANNSIQAFAVTPTVSFVANSVPAALPTTLNGASVIIGTPPTADLTVSNVAVNFDGAHGTNITSDPAQYTVTFRVNNGGTLAAPASTATVVVDGVSQNVAVGAVGTGTFVTATSATVTLTGTFDNIVITADAPNAITESNETNNSASVQASWQYPVPGQKTDVSGGIIGTISFTQPAAVSLNTTGPGGSGMNIGPNSVAGTLNVKSNQSWLISVQGTAPVTTTGAQADIDAGRMTKLTGTTYNAYIKLHQQLHVITAGGYLTPFQVGPTTFVTPTNANITLTGTAQPLAFGIPEGQVTDFTNWVTLGEDRTLTFAQQVLASDPSLAAGSIYDIVVNFTVVATPW